MKLPFEARPPRWAGTIALVSLVVVLAAGCASRAAGSSPTPTASASPGRGATLSAKEGRSVAVQVWILHLASLVGLNTNTLPDSEAGFQLETDKLAIPVYVDEGQQQNQAQPTGNVDWVALPPSRPQLAMLARIKTRWDPLSSSSVPQSSQDDLVILERQRPGEPWRILAYPSLNGVSDAQVAEVRQFEGPLSKPASLPIKPSSLPASYWAYVTGATNPVFSAGPLTDQLRASMAQGVSNASQAGGTLSYPFEAGSVIGSYGVGGAGDGLVFFGVRYAQVLDGPKGSCLVQSPSERGLPAIVPDGRYDQVRLEYRSTDVALEDKATGQVAILGAYPPVLVGESTTPTKSPACL